MDNWSTDSKKKTFEPHPPGPFAAVCVDVFTVEQTNTYFGQVNKFTGEVDNRKTITKACVAFLTSESIEIDGEMKPRYTSFWAPMSWHEKSKLRGFVSRWLPEVGKSNTVNPEGLIGQTALVNVENYPKRDGSTGHSVAGAMPLPKAMAGLVPFIPADYVRHKDKVKDEATAKPMSAPAPVANDEPNDPPF